MDEVIYSLDDPRDGLEFYVGRSHDIYQRFMQHLRYDRSNDAKRARIQELKSLHLLPIMKTLEIVRDDTALAGEREAYWIRHFKYLGRDLTNDVIYPVPRRIVSRTMNPTYAIDQVLLWYPEIESKWLAMGRKTATMKEIQEITGHSRRRLNKAPFARSSRNKELILVSSVLEWLKTAPKPEPKEIMTDELKPVARTNGHRKVTQPLGDLAELKV